MDTDNCYLQYYLGIGNTEIRYDLGIGDGEVQHDDLDDDTDGWQQADRSPEHWCIQWYYDKHPAPY